MLRPAGSRVPSLLAFARHDLAIRVGLLALPVGGGLYALGVLLRGALVAPDADGFAAWTASSGFDVYTSITLNVSVWAIFGVLALHAWLGDGDDNAWRFFGAAWSIAGLAVGLPVMGVMAMAWPAAPDAAAAMTETMLWQVWAPFSLAAFALGSVLLGKCLMGRGFVVVGATYALAGVLLACPFWHWVEFAGAVLLTWAGAGLAGMAWRVEETVP